MGREEQIEEREVLDSIFPDEITGEAIMSTFSIIYLVFVMSSTAQKPTDAPLQSCSKSIPFIIPPC